MEIRKMLIDDYEPVYELWRSCAGMGLNNLDDSREGIIRFLQRNPDTCLVTESEGQIAGVILAGHDGRRGYIYHTAVRAQFRRQGIARRLVETALETFRQIGINKTALVVFSRNEDGNTFWEKMGFTVRSDLTYRNRTLNEMTRNDT